MVHLPIDRGGLNDPYLSEDGPIRLLTGTVPGKNASNPTITLILVSTGKVSQ